MLSIGLLVGRLVFFILPLHVVICGVILIVAFCASKTSKFESSQSRQIVGKTSEVSTSGPKLDKSVSKHSPSKAPTVPPNEPKKRRKESAPQGKATVKPPLPPKSGTTQEVDPFKLFEQKLPKNTKDDCNDALDVTVDPGKIAKKPVEMVPAVEKQIAHKKTSNVSFPDPPMPYVVLQKQLYMRDGDDMDDSCTDPAESVKVIEATNGFRPEANTAPSQDVNPLNNENPAVIGQQTTTPVAAGDLEPANENLREYEKNYTLKKSFSTEAGVKLRTKEGADYPAGHIKLPTKEGADYPAGQIKFSSPTKLAVKRRPTKQITQVKLCQTQHPKMVPQNVVTMKRQSFQTRKTLPEHGHTGVAKEAKAMNAAEKPKYVSLFKTRRKMS